MGRIARVVAEGIPHHVTQRGNGHQVVFDDRTDRLIYLKLLREYAAKHELQIWAWCLMSNHVHLLAVPETSRSLARTLGRTHCDYARYRNARGATCGHLWQARYYSCPVDRTRVWSVMAYIERNPVRAGLAETAEEYAWSSAAAHISNRDTHALIDLRPWRECYTSERWRDAVQFGIEEEGLSERLRVATATGRPFGSADFVDELESTENRMLRPGRPGRPRRPARKEPGQLSLEIGV